MYVVTFYSFKGGVGRTMSLVNIASQIAKGGKRVLIVDFDLEAPGIPTFTTFASTHNKQGIVDYIVEYRNTGVAPDVRDYTYVAKTYESGGEISVMPAGLNDASYSSRLNSIDWNSLYSDEDGYVFFEDLKKQWDDAFHPDYVLIDSRTGHSDVEGICTRQLPNAVCFLFFPNEQNLEGLKRVVHNVRQENALRASSLRADQMALHFVVSNVPDLDDEDGIIGSTLNRFKRELKYDSLAGQLHHYDSLSLLNQVVFSESRPKSRLAKEYKDVTEAIISENLADRDVALAFVERTAREIRTPTTGAYFSIPIEKVDNILSRFPADDEILLQVALIYETIGRFSDALNLLSGTASEQSSYWYSIRARLHHRVGQKEKAAEDLARMLRSPKAEVASLLEALSIAPLVSSGLFGELAESEALKSLSLDQRVFVALQLEDGEQELPVKLAILESAQGEKTGHPEAIIKHALALTAIGMHKFDRAVEILMPDNSDYNALDISDAFNLAMAKFGRDGIPDVQIFSHVADLDSPKYRAGSDANYAFCIAIANAAAGRTQVAKELIALCREKMQARPRRDFSPWVYAKVSSQEFLANLKQFEEQVRSGVLVPGLLQREVPR